MLKNLGWRCICSPMLCWRLYLYYVVHHILNFLIVLIPTVKMRTMSYYGKTNLSLSLSLSLTKNQFILYQFLVECLLISFERIWKFQFSWFVNCSRFEINKKNDIVVRMAYMFISVCKLPLVANLISLSSRCLPNVKILKSGVDIRYLTLFLSCFGFARLNLCLE